jgi:predicted ATPase
MAKQLANIASHENDSSQLVDAQRMVGASQFWRGKLKAAREELQVVLDLYDPRQHATNAWLYGQDPAIVGRGYAAVTLWCLGYPDRGSAKAREALDPALAPNHAFSRLFAEILICWLYQFQGNIEQTQRHAEEAIALGADLRAAFWLAGGSVMRGWALAAQGEFKAGLGLIQSGLAQHRATGAVLITPYYLALLASTYERAGQLEEAIGTLDQALAIVRQTGESWYEAELHRLRGDLALSRTTADEELAETNFCQAIEIARQQSAKSWELRATISRARLLNKHGKRAEARQRLQATYDWFTEGFETPDLRQAKGLLAEWS